MVQKQNKDINYAAKHDIGALINIAYDLLPPCEITVEDDVLYLLFYTDMTADSIANLLEIHDSYINTITPITGHENHFAISLEHLRREIDE